MRGQDNKYSHRPQNSLRGIQINISSDPFQHRIPSYFQRVWQESKLRKWTSVVKRRCIKRFQQSNWIELGLVGLSVFAGCMLLLVHVGFFSGKKYQDWQQDHEVDVLEQVDLLEKVYPDEGRLQTTAVVWISQDHGSVDDIIKDLCEYDMFNSFIIWNDNPEIQLTNAVLLVDIMLANQQKQPIVTFKTYPTKRNLGVFMLISYDQLISFTENQVVMNPTLIHTGDIVFPIKVNMNTILYHTGDTEYKQEEVELHTCYIDIGSGTFVSKEIVSKFINKYSNTNEYADVHFILNMNQIPYQLEGHGSFTKELTTKEIEHLNQGLKTLYNDLKKNTPYSDSIMDPRHARASCGRDQCLFLTNVAVFPDVQLFSYNPTIDVRTLKQMHDDYIIKDYYQDHHYAFAVDEDDSTSWKSAENIRAGDYIGLDLLMPMRIPLKYRLVSRHPYAYISSIRIQISYDSSQWIKLHPSPFIKCEIMDMDDELLECHFIVSERGYRYIRLESQKDLEFGFDVHELSFNGKVKKDKNGQLLDIAFEQDGIAFVEDN
ncbi:hypothetical protein G6F47_006212 [Rhizopus delemar]|nr:hypothetical protein G6F54_004028 [Rhizopus delemar]KAG1515985.1 hypothetical protein G6F53_002504 [Rhizopus delemar]KAG1598670.1 hypothetical protein G6F47_006212 [Rhizopus delemar]